jgi:hypothetical protein
LQLLAEKVEQCLVGRVIPGSRKQEGDALHLARPLLSAGNQWPRHRSSTQQRDELAPLHSTTSSARPSSVAGISMPSALAVFRLIASSNLVGS